MSQLCFLADSHRLFVHVFEEHTTCGRLVTGLTRGTIPLGANATRMRSLVSCPACLAIFVDKALVVSSLTPPDDKHWLPEEP